MQLACRTVFNPQNQISVFQATIAYCLGTLAGSR